MILFTTQNSFKTEDENIEIIKFESEKELLLGWRQFFLLFDPDIVTGYDVVESLAVLMERAEKLF